MVITASLSLAVSPPTLEVIERFFRKIEILKEGDSLIGITRIFSRFLAASRPFHQMQESMKPYACLEEGS